jgi:hypothetical protein
VSILFLPWQQTVKGKGSVVALDPTERDYKILAPVEGFIEKFYVQENHFVQKGTPLFKMVDLDSSYLQKLEQIEKDLQYQIDNTKVQVENLQKEALQTKTILERGLKVYSEKVNQVHDKIEGLQFTRLSLQKSYDIAESNLERISTLYREGIESKRNFEVVENSFIKADADLKKVDIDIGVQKKSITILENERDKFISKTKNSLYKLDSQIVGVKNRAKKLLQQLFNQSVVTERYRNSEVVAPKSGYVVRLFKNDQNRYIKKGESVLHFAPEVSRKSILLKVTDFNMPLIKESLPVRIMFYGWPALQVSGWPQIKFGSFGGYIAKVEHISHQQGFYYAYVVEDPEDPWPEGDDLRMGTQATVWVRLSTVPIWYQLWRFINAIPPKMVHPENENLEN